MEPSTDACIHRFSASIPPFDPFALSAGNPQSFARMLHAYRGENASRPADLPPPKTAEDHRHKLRISALPEPSHASASPTSRSLSFNPGASLQALSPLCILCSFRVTTLSPHSFSSSSLPASSSPSSSASSSPSSSASSSPSSSASSSPFSSAPSSLSSPSPSLAASSSPSSLSSSSPSSLRPSSCASSSSRFFLKARCPSGPFGVPSAVRRPPQSFPVFCQSLPQSSRSFSSEQPASSSPSLPSSSTCASHVAPFPLLFASTARRPEARETRSEQGVQPPETEHANANPRWGKRFVGADKSALASGFAAVVTCCVLHPLDLIKTRLQVSAVTAGAIPAYASSAQAVREIWRAEGIRGLWKGVSATAAASGLSWGIFRYLFDVWRHQLSAVSSTSPHWSPSPMSAVLASSSSPSPSSSSLSSPSSSSSSVTSPSFSSSFVSSPSSSSVSVPDAVHIDSRLGEGVASASALHATGSQAASGGARWDSAESLFSWISAKVRRGDATDEVGPHTRQEAETRRGVSGAASASVASSATGKAPDGEDSRSRAVQTPGETANSLLAATRGDSESNPGNERLSLREAETDNVAFRANLAASIIAGFFSTLITHPLWLVKARMEMQAYETLGREGWPHYRNPLDCLLSIRRAGGVPALYAGLGPAVMLVPHAAVQILVYEEMKKRADMSDR
ncbi:carrier superfamily protein [Toxoplasma gondii VEG]|nr:carrier superfamily protein [Toxoplasma gondii VEG]KFG45993.1 mitochondrial carrier superfamily protein [Toxoplasma gondii p89]